MRSSSGSSPAIVLEVRSSPRLLIAGALFFTATLGVLAAVPHAPAWRVAVAAFTLVVLARPVSQLLASRGRGPVRRLSWGDDGTWRVEGHTGTVREARLARTSGILGPWIVLTWAAAGPPRRPWAVIDAAYTDPRVFRALKVRLRIASGRPPPQPGKHAARLAVLRRVSHIGRVPPGTS